jgi:hypothetical protein
MSNQRTKIQYVGYKIEFRIFHPHRTADEKIQNKHLKHFKFDK